MLLAIDVGNSQTAIGLFEGDSLAAHWRLTSFPNQTGDEIAVLLQVLLQGSGHGAGDLHGIALASVVPSITPEYREVGRRLGCEVLVIDHASVPDLPVLYHDPASVGADRLVNAVAARAAYGAPVIVVDLGTATTFDVVNAAGEYAGGVIAPGIATSANALFQRGARLAKVEIRKPAHAVGRTTEESLQSGIFYGAVGSVDALVRRIVSEMGFPPDLAVVATGGLAAAIAGESGTVTAVDEHLTLEGIRLVWSRAAGR